MVNIAFILIYTERTMCPLEMTSVILNIFYFVNLSPFLSPNSEKNTKNKTQSFIEKG